MVVPAPLRPLVRTSGDGVCGVLAHASPTAGAQQVKVLSEEANFQILCLLGATPPAFPSRIPRC